MIITCIGGGLGNQLFQYAFGRFLAYKNETELKFDALSNNTKFKLDVFKIPAVLVNSKDLSGKMKYVEEKLITACVTEFESDLLDLPDNVILHGNWQCERYFKDIRDILLKELTLKNPLHKNSALWEQKILSTENSVALHVRCGDYFSSFCVRNFAGIITAEYYLDCLKELKKILPNFKLFVFSNDLNWTKENLKFDVPVEFVEDCEKDFEELYLMSICKHNIISHSTFSWWGAWLNKNPDKKVLTPTPWSRGFWENRDMIPENWIRIPVDYEKNSLISYSPLLSVIILVEDNCSLAQFSIVPVLNQMFKEYEVIILDKSTGDNGKICRQFADNEKVTFIKFNPSLSKSEILNKALEICGGDYIVFLINGNFVYPYVLQMLCENLDKYLGKYGRELPDLICSTQYLEENSAGEIDIGIPNKRFSFKIDEPFKDLNQIAEIKIDDRQKLMLLANQQINNSLSTKFFKRKFLNENKITFKCNGGGANKYFTLFD